MDSRIRVLVQSLWDYKWWWLVPLSVMVALFLMLVLLADITGDSPFVYTLF